MYVDMKTLTTVDDVIAMFDGPAKVARWAHLTTNAVCWWRHRGIPPSMHLRLLIEAHRRGFQIAPELFELEPDDWKYLYSLTGDSGVLQATAA